MSHRACRCTCPSGSRHRRRAWWWGPWPEAARKGGTSAEKRYNVSLFDDTRPPSCQPQGKAHQHTPQSSLPSPPGGPGSTPPGKLPHHPFTALCKRHLLSLQHCSCTACLHKPLARHASPTPAVWGGIILTPYPTFSRFRALLGETPKTDIVVQNHCTKYGTTNAPVSTKIHYQKQGFRDKGTQGKFLLAYRILHARGTVLQEGRARASSNKPLQI